jgi:hypothetical protein
MSKKARKRLVSSVLLTLFAAAVGQPAAAAEENSGAAYTAEDVTVEASPAEWEEALSPGTVTIIRPDDHKGEQKSLAELLKEVPGVHVREVNGIGQYTTVSVRGSTAAQVGVFVDGILTNLGGDAAVDISAIPVKNIARIEVYRAYIPARFGGTFMGGVINIVTKKPTKSDIAAEIGVSSFGGRQAGVEVSAPVGVGSLLVGVNYESSDGDFPYRNYAAERKIPESRRTIARLETRLADPSLSQAQRDSLTKKLAAEKEALASYIDDTRHRRYNDRSQTDILAKWQSKDWTVKAAYKHLDRHLPDGLWVNNPNEATGRTDIDRKDILREESLRQKITSKEILIENRRQGKRLSWGWMLDYMHQDKTYRAERGVTTMYPTLAPLREWSRYKSNKYNLQIDGSYQLGDRQLLDFQMNYSSERMNVNGSLMDKVLSSSDATALYAQMRNRYKQEIFNVQVQDTVILDAKNTLFFTPALRYNRSKITGYSDAARLKNVHFSWIHPRDTQTDGHVTWQLALKKDFTPHFSMRMTGGTYYRLLNMYEIAGDGAGILPATRSGYDTLFPQPEEGKQIDLSAIWDGKALGGAHRTMLTLFWRSADRMLQLRRAGLDYFSYFNDARGTVRGIEMQTNMKWKKFAVSLAAAYTKSSVERKDSIHPEDGYLSMWATYQPEWEGNLRLTYTPTERLSLFGEAHYTDEYFTMNTPSKNKAYARADGHPLSSLTVFNAGVKWKPQDQLLVSLGCSDVFNRRPKQKVNSTATFGTEGFANAAYPLQGRTYYATIRYEF